MAVIRKFQELERKVKTGLKGSVVTRKFSLQPYDAFPDVVAQILGQIRYVNGKLIRTLPMNDSLLPQCFATEVNIDGVGAFTSANNPTTGKLFDVLNATNSYAEADLTVTYESGSHTSAQMATNSEAVLCTMDFDFSGKSLTLPNEYFNWVNSPTYNLSQSAVNATKFLPECQTQIVRHYCVNRPINAILKLASRINAADFTVQDILFPKETLRFETANIKENVTYNDVKYYEINYKFSVQGIYELCATANETLASDGTISVACTTALDYVGWNRIFRPDRGYWDYVISNVGSRKPYLPDTDITQSVSIGTITGFEILFHPEAR